jgi:hypothetical protein
VTSRIKGPGDGPPRIGETDAIDAPDAVAGPDATEAPSAVAGPQAARATDPTDAVARVAARLKSGEIDVDRAVELLIDDAIERQVGRAVDANASLAPKLRELLRNYAASDPYLAAKIRKLTLVK